MLQSQRGLLLTKICHCLTLACLLQLILCSDLENDFINPHDASQKLNVWVVSGCPHQCTSALHACAAGCTTLDGTAHNTGPRLCCTSDCFWCSLARSPGILLCKHKSASADHAVGQAPEIGVQLLLSVMTLLGRKWLFGPLQLVLTAYNMRLVGRKQAFTDVTDIFSQLGREKKVRIYKLIFYLVSFVYCVFR